MEAHARYMRQALALASQGLGRTSPNPAVGALVVKGGRVVGRGYHRRAGRPHAEIEALRQAGARARGATLYVTLEPCNHTGRTGPCCEAIIAAGISRVVAATRDPNPKTNGNGFAWLRRAGLRVVVGVCEPDAKRLIESFTTWIRTKRPWVVAKVAQSLDGKIATSTGQSRWISSPASRRLAHQLRERVDAVMVGVNTVLRDNPRLSARTASGRLSDTQPIKVIVDSRLRTPLFSRCLTSSASPAPTIMATTSRGAARRARFERRGVTVLVFPPASEGRVPLKRLCKTLGKRFAITSMMLEGGGELLASAFQEKVVDQVLWCTAPMLLGGRSSPSSIGGTGISRLKHAVRLRDVQMQRLGSDLLIDAAVVYPNTVHRP